MPYFLPRRRTDESLTLIVAANDYPLPNATEKSGTPAITTKQFENGDTDPRLSTLHKWCRTLEAAGVLFINTADQPKAESASDCGARRGRGMTAPAANKANG
jgi:hypothetical protein